MSGHEYDDNASETEESCESSMAGLPASPPSVRAANLVLLAGGASLAFGVALTFAPLLSAGLAGLGRTLFRFGYDASAFTWAGGGLLAVGAVGRALLRGVNQETDFGIIGDEINYELSGIRDSVITISETVAQLAGSQQTLLHRQELLESDEHTSKERNYDAVFRLAASLDQLSARLDERVSSLATEIQQRTGSVTECVRESRAALQLELQSQVRTQTEALSEMIALTTAPPVPQQAPVQVQASAPESTPAQAPAPVPTPAPAPVLDTLAPPAAAVPTTPIASLAPAQPPSTPSEEGLHIYVELEEENEVSEIGREILGELSSIEPALPTPAPQPGPTEDLYGAPQANSASDLDSLLPEDAVRRLLDDERDRA